MDFGSLPCIGVATDERKPNRSKQTDTTPVVNLLQYSSNDHAPPQFPAPNSQSPSLKSIIHRPTYGKANSYGEVMMMFTTVLTVLASLVISVLGQDDTQGPIKYDVAHNMTSIYGTWSSGSKNVVTGPVCCIPATPTLLIDQFIFSKGFANPANMTFVYPKTTGVSYSLCVTFSQS